MSSIDRVSAISPLLRVYVSPDCPTWHISMAIIDAVRRARPAQRVRVIDLAKDPDTPLPNGVVGTPTYMLDAHVISMGNPELAELLAWLDDASHRASHRAHH
ncbi:thioredoxin domain-containing protein [Haloechinothrix halophila]|uniref:hypothetical protein n=1 Tax=Haloechinothrix halophila TaxID=1069073 RepID=UPI0004279759|nr:hypothetical protein [Haloechinothrix halophila]